MRQNGIRTVSATNSYTQRDEGKYEEKQWSTFLIREVFYKGK